MLVLSDLNLRIIEYLLFVNDAGIERGRSTIESDTTVGALRGQHTFWSNMVADIGTYLLDVTALSSTISGKLE